MSLTTTFAPSARHRQRDVAADAAAGAGDEDLSELLLERSIGSIAEAR